ncbi:V-type ATP synthase subunit F [bacterium]|nr:V-type ATP synthase subunit F [bacterium]
MVLGFKLVGIAGEVADSAGQALAKLKEVINKNVKIILISDRLTESIQDEIEEIIVKMNFPLVIEIPDRQGAREGKKSIQDIMKSSLGFNI